MDNDPRRHQLRGGFDLDAETFDRTRHVFPPEFFSDMFDLTGLAPGCRLLEIGCGTGQATVPLAERGLTVTAIELGPRLAAVARHRLATFPLAEVLTGSFEGWDYGGAPFDAVAAFNRLGLAETPASSFWWFDVETGNSWRSDVSLNVASLRGAAIYLGSVAGVAAGLAVGAGQDGTESAQADAGHFGSG